MSKVIPYRPSNGLEGEEFEAQFCRRCVYDRGFDGDDRIIGCPILARAIALGIGEPDFPSEWISDENGDNPRCTHFRMVGTGTHAEATEQERKYQIALAEMREAQQ